MSKTTRVVTVAVLVAVAAAVAAAVVQGAKVKRNATAVADDIEAQLDDLDPVTRAAVVGKLSADAAKSIRPQRST